MHGMFLGWQDHGKFRQVSTAEVRCECGERDIMSVADICHVGIVAYGIMIISAEANIASSSLAIVIIFERNSCLVELLINIIYVCCRFVFVVQQSMRLLVGVAESPSFPGNARLVAAWFPANERGTASAIFNSAQYFATALFGPVMPFQVRNG